MTIASLLQNTRPCQNRPQLEARGHSRQLYSVARSRRFVTECFEVVPLPNQAQVLEFQNCSHTDALLLRIMQEGSKALSYLRNQQAWHIAGLESHLRDQVIALELPQAPSLIQLKSQTNTQIQSLHRRWPRSQ